MKEDRKEMESDYPYNYGTLEAAMAIAADRLENRTMSRKEVVAYLREVREEAAERLKRRPNAPS